MDKIVRNEGKSQGKKNRIADLNTVLPFGVAMSVAGVASLVSSVLYVILKNNIARSDLLILSISLMGFFVFLGIWVCVMIFGIKRNKELAKDKMEHDKEILFNQLKKCEECSNYKINNALEYNSIFDEVDVNEKEKRFKDDNNAELCEVYIYVSDVSILVKNIDIMKDNLAAGIKYYVFYYNDELKCSEIFDLIGNKNMYCLNGLANEYQNIDEKMSKSMVNFKYILFNRHPNSIFGYASFDNISQQEKDSKKSTHSLTHDFSCNNCCNYDKNRSGVVGECFYYRLTYRRTSYILAKLISLIEEKNNEAK